MSPVLIFDEFKYSPFTENPADGGSSFKIHASPPAATGFMMRDATIKAMLRRGHRLCVNYVMTTS